VPDGAGFYVEPSVDDQSLRPSDKALRRIKRRDRIAAYVITMGGVLVVCAVLGILFVILSVAYPLFLPAETKPFAEIAPADLPGTETVAIGIGEYLETAYVIDAGGMATFYELPDGTQHSTTQLERPDGASTVGRAFRMSRVGDHALFWDNGAVTVARVEIRPQFDDAGVRTFRREAETAAAFEPIENGPAQLIAVSLGEDDAATRVAVNASGALFIEQVRVSTGFLDQGERTVTTETVSDVTQGNITALVLDAAGEQLYVGSDEGYLGRWSLREPGSSERLNHFKLQQDRSAITSLAMIFGDYSVAVADSSGAFSTWFPVSSDDGGATDLREIHVFPKQAEPVVDIIPAQDSKAFYTKSSDGALNGWHMTSEKHLLAIDVSGEAELAGLADRGNGIAVLADNTLQLWSIDAPHPETSFGTLFTPVWYEKYPAPSLTWQSSASSDDFEPKLSLVPLIFGSFKGTIYAMVFAVPLALFGAIYTSQFAANSVAGSIKSAIEIMAAIPSVVIGFLAALWFAPILDRFIVPALLALIVFPIVLIGFVALWHPFRETRFAKRVRRGYEFVVVVPVLAVAGLITFMAGGWIESTAFGGSFQQWLFDTSGQTYDQRNSIVIAFALGFAVVPLIFTIAEDAISNVPFGLRAASLALGASRWQTVWRVVLPSASPGIFAAMIIGFGRAVGETMIVLMATGNTPILDISPFNGMRTLSANIAVEIPEAPVDGTLYRVLFLSAVLLLILTSILNTAADLIRQRLRKKYGQFQ
jgi:phosphate transport system permease protein